MVGRYKNSLLNIKKERKKLLSKKQRNNIKLSKGLL